MMRQEWRYARPAEFPFPAAPAADRRTPEILDAGWYYDGGSVRVVFVDKEGRTTTCCFDHRRNTDTPGRLYIGDSPTAPGSRPALVDEERVILAQLRTAVRSLYPRDLRRKLLSKRYDTQVPAAEHRFWLVLRELDRRGIR